MPQHDPVVNPSLHYLGVVGATTLQDHAACIAQNDRIKAERSDEYGPDGAYNHQLCNSHGIRFEGRGWNRDGAANGGENGIWYNAGSRSLCVLVGTEDVITDVCKAGIRAWANEAVARGMQWPLRGHSEFVATSCPGDHLRVVVQEVNANPASSPPSDDSRKAQDVIYLEENGKYWQMGLGDFVQLPEKVGAGAKLNGGAVVPISTLERIAMGISAKAQATAFLKSAGLVK